MFCACYLYNTVCAFAGIFKFSDSQGRKECVFQAFGLILRNSLAMIQSKSIYRYYNLVLQYILGPFCKVMVLYLITESKFNKY